MELKIHTDGGALNNPGPAASAFVMYRDDKEIYSEGKAIGPATNNDAEYTALINALGKVKEMLNLGTLKDVTKISVYADSDLMVHQVNGLWKIKHAPIQKYMFEIRALEVEIGLPISYTYVPREQNTVADGLVKKALGR
ncbi:MAG: ribonuclease HI family protein [Patescibacteria group bacterium]